MQSAFTNMWKNNLTDWVWCCNRMPQFVTVDMPLQCHMEIWGGATALADWVVAHIFKNRHPRVCYWGITLLSLPGKVYATSWLWNTGHLPPEQVHSTTALILQLSQMLQKRRWCDGFGECCLTSYFDGVCKSHGIWFRSFFIINDPWGPKDWGIVTQEETTPTLYWSYWFAAVLPFKGTIGFKLYQENAPKSKNRSTRSRHCRGQGFRVFS